MNKEPGMVHPFATLVLILLCGLASAAPLDTSFTFQGELQESSVPAVGDYEFEFVLFDAESGGVATSAIIGQTLSVDDGIFTTRLDFGDAPFAGDAVWLEVRVRSLGGGAFTTLAPRQSIVNSPYALHAQFVGANSVTGSSVVNGSLTGADLAAGTIGSNEVDSNQVQLRLTGACAAGEAIRAVDSNGDVTCAVLDDGDWFNGPLALTTDKQASIGSLGRTGARLFVLHDSTIGAPQVELRELGQDYSRLMFRVNGPPGDEHFQHWTIAARTEPDSLGGPDTDRINFFNSRSGDLMVLLGNGRLGLGVFDPTSQLDVNGGARLRGLADPGASNPRPVQVDAAGNLLAATPPALRRVAVSYAAFKPTNSSSGYQLFASRYSGQVGSSISAAADVQVPDGADIQTIRAYLYDNSSAKDIEVSLWRHNPASNSIVSLGTIRSSGVGSGPEYREFTVLDTGPRYDAQSPLSLFVRPVLDGSSTPTTWETELGIGSVIIEYTPP